MNKKAQVKKIIIFVIFSLFIMSALFFLVQKDSKFSINTLNPFFKVSQVEAAEWAASNVTPTIYYKFNTEANGTNGIDYFGDINLTNDGKVNYTTGKLGKAAAILGSYAPFVTAFYHSSTPKVIFGTENFTIVGWYSFITCNGQGIARIGGGGAGQWQTLCLDSTKISFESGSTIISATVPTLAGSGWHHYAWVREGTGTNQFKIYVDGVNLVNGTINTNITSTADFVFINAPTYLVDEFAIYKGYALNASDISYIYNSGNGRELNATGTDTPDTIYPIFYNITINPLSGTSIDLANINFTTNINNTNGTTGLQFNNVNYSMTNISNFYNKTILNISAGTYSYCFWAYGNGTARNYNSTCGSYVVNSTPPEPGNWIVPFTPTIYYKFNTEANGTNGIDYFGDINLTNDGKVNYTTGKLGKAVAVVSSYAPFVTAFYHSSTPKAIFDTRNFTISFWINATSCSDQGIVSVGGAGAGEWQFWCSAANSNAISFTGSGTHIYGNTSIINSRWNHVVFTREGTGTNQGKLYWNGQQVSQGTINGNISSTNNFAFINAPLYAIDEFAIWNNASLNSSQIATIYNSGNGIDLNQSIGVTASITYPLNTTYTTNVTELNYTIVGNATSCWYSLNGGANTTIACGVNITNITSSQGSNTWSVTANRTNSISVATVVFFVNTSTLSTVNITYPLNSSYVVNVTQFNYTIIGGTPTNCWYSLDGGTNTSVTCGVNITNITSTNGNHYWSIYANSTDGITTSTIRFNVNTRIPLAGWITTEAPSVYFKFDNYTGANSTDYYGKIFLNSTTSPTVPELVTYTPGLIGMSAKVPKDLDLTYQKYYGYGDISGMRAYTNNFTLSAWINTTDCYQTGIGGLNGKTGINEWDFGCTLNESGNYWNFAPSYRENADTVIILAWSNIYIRDGKWHHVVFTRRGTQVLRFIDGINDANGTSTTNLSAPNAIHVRMQSTNGNMQYDEWAYWNNYSLTNAEIALVYNSGLGRELNTTSYSLSATLNSPSNNYNQTSQNITLNWTVSSTNLDQITNYTLTVWYANNSIAYTEQNLTLNTTNENFVVTRNFTANNYTWNVNACGTYDTTYCTTSSNYNFKILGNQAPVITWSYQKPTSLTTTSIANESVVIQYNITGINPINVNSVDLFWLTNGSVNPNFSWYVNGSILTTGFRNFGVSKFNISNTWNFSLSDNVYPTTTLLNISLFDNSIHSYFNLTTDNYLMKTLVLNMTNTTKYNFLEFDTYNLSTGVASLRVYYCNSSYSTGNLDLTTNCGLASNILETQGYNHIENQSRHWVSSITTNTTSGTIAGIKITPTAYFIWRGRTTGWAMGYIPTIARADVTQTSTNNGVSYSTVSGTQDTHLHQFSDDTKFNYYACANLTFDGIYSCSETKVYTFNQSALPPSPPLVYYPNSTGTYGTSITINYTAAVSPVNNTIVRYNISLYNSNDVYNRSIKADNGVNLSFIFNNTDITDGLFNIHVQAIDSAGLTSLGESENFNITATFNLSTAVITNPVTPINYGVASNWSCSGNYLNAPTEMWVNGVNKTSEKGLFVIRAAGFYSINCSVGGTGGLTGGSQVSNYIINKVVSPINLTISPSTNISYGTLANATGTECPSQLSCILTRNGVSVSNPDLQNLSAGTYVYNYSTSGNTNYTANSSTYTLTVNKITPSLVLTISPGTTVINGTSTTVTGTGCPDSSCVLRRDGSLVTNPEITTLSIGSYVYNYSFAGSTNYNAYSVISALSVVPVSFAGTSGSINFTGGNLSQSLSFQVPYRFVTSAYMNLTQISGLKATTTSDSYNAVDFDDTTYVSNGTNLYLNFSMTSSSRNLSGLGYFPISTVPLYCYNYTSGGYISVGNMSTGNFSMIIPTQCENANNYSLFIDLGTSPIPNSNDILYEISLNGTYNQIYPSLNVSISNKQIFYNPSFNQTNNKTQNFYAQLNPYLASCTYIGNYCIVPIQFNSSTPGILNYSDVKFNNEGFIEVSQSYNSSTFETSREGFTLNLQYDSSVYTLSGTLYYNNTAYTGTASTTGFNGVLSANIDIPLITSQTNKSFYWRVGLTNSSGTNYYNSTFNNQTINNVTLFYCPPTTSGNRLLNFTAYNESDLTRLNPFSFSSTFMYYLGNGNIKKILSLSNLSAEEIGICLINSSTINIITDANIEYGKAGYTERDYYLSAYSVPNTLTPIYLYLSPEEVLTSFILKVQDQSLRPIAQAFIYIQRYYPSDNEYRTVQVVETDDNGESVGFYKTETADYRHIIIKDGETLLTTNKQKIVPKSVPYTLIFTVGDAVGIPSDVFVPDPNTTTSIVYNKTTKRVTYTYNKDGADSGRLFVLGLFPGNSSDTIPCDTTENSSSGTITCDLTNKTGKFIARGFVDGEEVEIVNIDISDAKDTFGKEGLFIGLFIIMVAGFAFIWNPSAGIVAINAAIIFTNIIGLITFSPLFIFGSISISIIALWLLKT